MRAGAGRRLRWAFIALALPLASIAQVVRERVAVDLVRVDLVVRDHSGKFLRDIRAGEVHLEIDGKTCPIDGFELLEPSPAPPAGETGQKAENAPALAPADSSPSSSSSAPRPAFAMEFFVDETSSHQFDRTFVYRRLKEAFAGDLPNDTRLALDAYDGTLRVLCPWTSDLQQFREALANANDHSVAARLGPPGALSSPNDLGRSSSDSAALELEFHIRNSRSALIEALYRFPQDAATRKTLFFVSDGGPFLTSGDLARELVASTASAANRLPDFGSVRADAKTRQAEQNATLLREGRMSAYKAFSEWTDVAELAVQRGVTLVPVRAAPLPTGTFFSADFAGDGYSDTGSLATSARTVDAIALGSYGAAGQSMSEVAEWTGGEAVVSREALRNRVKRDLDERSLVYVLTFRDPRAGDGLFHSIQIRVDRPGARLEYRRSYRIPGGQEAIEDRVVMALYGQPAENPLNLHATAHVVKRERKAQTVDLEISYPAAAAPGAENQKRDLWIVGVCSNAAGQRTRVFHIRSQAGPVRGETGRSYSAPVRLRTDPDTRLISLAVQDTESGIVSYVGVPLAP